MPDPLETRRQGMQQKAADKLLRRDCHLSVLFAVFGPVLFVLECDLAVLYISQPVIADGDTMGIAAQIVDDLLGAAEWRLGVDHPFPLPERTEQRPEGIGFGQWRQVTVKGQTLLFKRLFERFEKQAAEQARQNADAEEESPAPVDPTRAIGPQAAAGDDRVNVGMVGERLAPGMKNGKEADFGAEMFGVAGNGLERGRGGGEEQVIEHLLVLQGQRIELFGNGEDDVEIGNRQ